MDDCFDYINGIIYEDKIDARIEKKKNIIKKNWMPEFNKLRIIIVPIFLSI